MTDRPTDLEDGGHDPDLLPGRDYGRGALSPEDVNDLAVAAHTIGLEHGRNRGTWAEWDAETARRYLVGVECGDGMRTDEVEPDSTPLAGEWADDYSTADLVRDIGAELYPEEEADLEGDLADAYADGWWSALRDELVTSARRAADLEDPDAYAAFVDRIDRVHEVYATDPDERTLALRDLEARGTVTLPIRGA